MAALGGNALLQRGEKPAAEIQQHHVVEAVTQLAKICEHNDIVLTHGNGPQVGMLALESANDPLLEHAFPFDALGAQTQGMIGYWLVEALSNAVNRRVVALVTRTIVDSNDPAFAAPTKFVGRGYSKDDAVRLGAGKWSLRLDGALWRRVVASPEPVEILEMATIEGLVRSGTIVVCAGGGGIPVARDKQGQLSGVEAVIDKDLGAALLARDVKADALLILTDVPCVYADYGLVTQRPLHQATVTELRVMDFAAGSMGPKVEAVCRFVNATGKRAAIGTFEDAPGLLDGSAGTTILP